MTDLIAHADRAHSMIGGSTAKRVMNCTASVNLCAQYPNVESSFAAEGTALHEAVDLILQGKTKKDTDVIGVTFNGYEIDEDYFDTAISPALEMFDAVDKELGGIDYFNEQRVVFPGIDNAFGTVDIIGFARDRTIVWDWKFGSGVGVVAEANEQLMYYAYAAAHTAPMTERFDRDKPIELFIAQPRIRDGEPFTRWVTTWTQLEAFALELRKAVAISQTPEASYKLGDWCKFCNAKTGCPLYTNKVREITVLTAPEMQETLEEWLPWAERMIRWAEDVKQMGHQYLEQGGALSDWKLVNKRANRFWVDEDEALKFMAKMKLPAEQRFSKKILTPAKAETLLKPLGVSAIPEKLVDKKSAGTTLAPLSDPRPAVRIGITSGMDAVFTALEAQQSKPKQET